MLRTHQLLNHVLDPCQAKVLAMSHSAFRRILTDGTGWESPRPPFEVRDEIEVYTPRGWQSCDSKPPSALIAAPHGPSGLLLLFIKGHLSPQGLLPSLRRDPDDGFPVP